MYHCVIFLEKYKFLLEGKLQVGAEVYVICKGVDSLACLFAPKNVIVMMSMAYHVLFGKACFAYAAYAIHDHCRQVLQ